MIRYQISRADLEGLIDAAAPSWRERAKTRTEHFKEVGEYDEKSGIWSEIKTVFMDLQHNKCAYCERALEDKEYGKLEHDLEHYRPKGNVQAWPTEMVRHSEGIAYEFATGVARPKGYYWLAYEILNYATACKSCNSSLKLDFFPIAGDRALDAADAPALAAELPLLVYPISDVDDDPESVVTFEGILPVPSANDEDKKRRARVTIDFFRLDRREHLRRERAERIHSMSLVLRILDLNLPQDFRDEALQALATATAANAPHASCLRAFLNLYAHDPVKATELAKAAGDYLAGKRS